MSDSTKKQPTKKQPGKDQGGLPQATPDKGIPAINILRIRGARRPTQATLHNGVTVQRRPVIAMPGLEDVHPQGGNAFQIMDYDDHFTYKHPISGNLFCTCGALAFVLLPTPGIPQTYFYRICCKFDADTGFRGLHQTSILNKNNFDAKHAGRTIRIDEWMR